MRVTAGESGTILEQIDAWNAYADAAGILTVNFDPYLSEDPSGLTAVLYPPAYGVYWFYLQSMLAREAPFGALNAASTGATGPLLAYPVEWTSPVQVVNADPLTTHRSARAQLAESRDAALADIRRRLDRAKAAYNQRPPRDVLDELGDDLGVAQLDMARAIGVTPTAVRKWRRGESARPEHRDRLSQLAALLSLLTQVGIHDPAGWIDIPISAESTLTPVDLFRSGNADLVALLGAGAADPQEVLDAFHPRWRREFARDDDYEVVTLADGSRSVVPRREVDG